ncbi:MAG: DUF7832 domain-containing protein [Burkholderiales bacterium]
MDNPVVYDKAKWHYDGDYPADLPQSQAFVHTGLFLGWLIDQTLISEEFLEDFGAEMERFKRREITGPRLFELCDGALVDDMLNDEGNAFAEHYFDLQTGKFVKDYEEIFCKRLPSMYHVEDSWANYDKLKQRVDERYAAWKQPPKKRRFGLF